MIYHRARPGPLYWSWRCLRCGERCDDHAGVIRLTWMRLVRKLRRWSS